MAVGGDGVQRYGLGGLIYFFRTGIELLYMYGGGVGSGN
jgi:hypothetical protein